MPCVSSLRATSFNVKSVSEGEHSALDFPDIFDFWENESYIDIATHNMFG